MLFSIGVEVPKGDDEAFGLIVPALCNGGYGCFSAADSEQEIVAMATEAITMMVEEMLEDGVSLSALKDKGVLTYQKDEEYAYCDTWLMLDVDISKFEGKPKRINISLPDVLIQRIDDHVKHSSGRYKDRSDFLATAARHEMQL
ncbi:type II toxin-antitoxin system HicB family antitoxin [Vibrio harveyi]|uniref:type II toxin-antitoxin system HicB family antitoxin n=1 Tax=Vibrio harveyi TaxID=669 RepID=UPI00069D8914|nr:type II toxin-antitoxin system HicB family antitoxin [Vibrio harveyi]KNY41665.1 hypothetical protein AKG93_17250 [Vibrio harveyi]